MSTWEKAVGVSGVEIAAGVSGEETAAEVCSECVCSGSRKINWGGLHRMVGKTFTIAHFLCFLQIVSETDIFLQKYVFDGEVLSISVAEWLYYIARKAQELKVGREQLGAINFVLIWQHGLRFMSYDVTQSFSENNLLSYIPLSEWILTLY